MSLKKQLLFINIMLTGLSMMFSNQLLAFDSSQPSEHIVLIEAFQFKPTVLNIKAGDTVTWINKDIVPHTATAIDSSWDTGMLLKDKSKSIIFDSDAELTYFCFYHPNMKANLRLKMNH